MKIHRLIGTRKGTVKKDELSKQDQPVSFFQVKCNVRNHRYGLPSYGFSGDVPNYSIHYLASQYILIKFNLFSFIEKNRKTWYTAGKV
jgi:hypothetical protein